jgi:hypothetical protein
MPASQAGRRRFEPGLPLQLFNAFVNRRQTRLKVRRFNNSFARPGGYFEQGLIYLPVILMDISMATEPLIFMLEAPFIESPLYVIEPEIAVVAPLLPVHSMA